MGLIDKTNGVLARSIEDTGALLEGHFRLSSGLHSNIYLQCARIFLDPKISGNLISFAPDFLEKYITQYNIRTVVAPAVGGILVGYELARVLGMDSVFFERVNGEFALRRGFEIDAEQSLLVAEDVISTGKSVLEVVSKLDDMQSDVVAVFCILNRSGKESLEFKGKEIPIISLGSLKAEYYEADNLPDSLKNIPLMTPGSRFLSKKS